MSDIYQRLPDVIDSPAFDAVCAAHHPSPADGGPCATCAFRPGTEAANSPHTVALAKACVEGLAGFFCHEKPGLCHGWIAAANLRGAPETEEDKRHCEAAFALAGILGDAIQAGVEAEKHTGQEREHG